MRSDFRKDIQGLRALAVISIFFYHLNLLHGGFLGVDIFFVISGYVITKSILINRQNNLNFFDYIFKRLKRLYVPLLFLILFCSIIISIIFIPHHINHFSKSSFYSILFISNFYFWQNTNHYFDLDKTLQPLLHTWSLGVEMQFYLFFGLVLFLLSKNKIIPSLLFLFMISLIMSEANAEREMSFWLMPFRLYEFVIGSIVYLLPKKKLNNYLENSISIFCLILLVFGLFFYNENIKFPGLNAFYISLLTGILIYMNNENIVNNFLSSSVPNYIGKISYSFYLVHWPVIVFYSYSNPQGLAFLDYIFIFFITFIISFFFHNYFENFNFSKFRISKNINFTFFMIVSSLLIYLVTNDFIQKSNFKIYSKESKILLQNKNFASQTRERFLEENTIIYEGSKKKFKNLLESKKNILIIGDSHSEDIFAGFLQINNEDYDIYWQHLPLECNSALTRNPNWHVTEKILFILFNRIPWTERFYEMCNNYYLNLKKSKNLKKLDYVIISMKWDHQEIKYIEKISDFFNKNSNAKIIFVSRRIEIPDLEKSILVSKNNEQLNSFLEKHKKKFDNLNNILKVKIKTVKTTNDFYDLNKFICNKEKCNFIEDNGFNYIDYSHFSLKGSKEIVKKFFNDYFK